MNDLQKEALAELRDPPKPKRKYRRRKQARVPRVAVVAKSAAGDEFLGLTPLDCGIGCNTGRCIITGWAHCGHPRKGGLQAAEMQNPETLKRFNRAKKYLAKQTVDRQHRDT